MNRIIQKIIETLSTEPMASDDFEIAVLRAFQPYQAYFPENSYRMVIEDGVKCGAIVVEGEVYRVVRPSPTEAPVSAAKTAESVPAATSTPWKPIHSAPCDGTSVLVGYGTATLAHLDPVVGFYGNYHPNSPGKQCWRCSHTRAKIYEPLYWMPIPGFPEEN